jgi:hypothetical protein
MSPLYLQLSEQEIEMGVELQKLLQSSEIKYMKLRELPSQQKEKQGKWTLELERAVAKSAILVEEPFVAVDKNKQPMIVYLPHHLSMQMVQETERELLHLQKNYPPPEVNGGEDNRHYMMKRVLEIYPKEKVGRYHFAWWCSVGNPHREPVLSIDSRRGGGFGEHHETGYGLQFHQEAYAFIFMSRAVGGFSNN